MRLRTALTLAATIAAVGAYLIWPRGWSNRDFIPVADSTGAESPLWAIRSTEEPAEIAEETRAAILESGEPTEVGSAVVTGNWREILPNLESGSEVRIPLPGGREVTGRVNLALREEGGTVRIGGSLTGLREGTFALHLVKDRINGRVLIPAEQVGFLISSPSESEAGATAELNIAEILCFPMPRLSASALSVSAQIESPGPQAAPPLLSSRPEATAVLYLDFDGATVTDPDWNSGVTINAVASTLSNGSITDVFLKVQEEFLSFDVDITTDPSRYAAAPVGRRMRVIITATDAAAPDAGGVALLDSFSRAGDWFSDDVPAWVFEYPGVPPNALAAAVAHEFGHTLGLAHDGRSSPMEEYYLGGSDWAPIMGAPNGQQLDQWSKGEYPAANNFEDDIAIIAGLQPTPLSQRPEVNDPISNQTGFIPDDHGDTRSAATESDFLKKQGQITSAADSDFFRFTVPQFSLISMDVRVLDYYSNLDILSELQDANGVVLHSANPDSSRNGNFEKVVPAGTYYVRVRGGGKPGNGSAVGYTDYGSTGRYEIYGNLVPQTPPSIQTHPVPQYAHLGDSVTFSVQASGTGPFTYQWRKDGLNLAAGGRITASPGSPYLHLNDVRYSDIGAYSVLVSSPSGSVASNAAALTVEAPAPLQLKLGQLLNYRTGWIGATVTLSPTGSSPLHTYQWYHNGKAIAGATQSSFGVRISSTDEYGEYFLVASNATETVQSDTITIGPSIVSPETSWMDATEVGGVVYFLFKNPSRILRYDLQSESWLPDWNLNQEVAAFAVADDFIYLASGSYIRRYSRELTGETNLASVANPISSLAVAGGYLVVVTSNYGYSLEPDLVALNRQTGATTATGVAGYYLRRGFSYSASTGKLYARSSGISPSDISAMEVKADGTLGAVTDSPYHGGYDDGYRTMVIASGAQVTDTSGVVYRASDLNFVGALGGQVSDVVDLPGGDLLALRPGRLSRLDANLLESGSKVIDQFALRVWLKGNSAFLFGIPESGEDRPRIQKVALSELAPDPVPPAVNPEGLRFAPEHVTLGNGIVYFYSQRDRNLIRWSVAEERYLSTLPIADKPEYLAYSATEDAIYYGDGGRRIRRIALSGPQAGISAPYFNSGRNLRGLQVAGSKLLYVDDSNAWNTHHLLAGPGMLLAWKEWNYYSREYVWDPNSSRLYFFRDSQSPNDLHYETITDTGFGATGETPYHGQVDAQLPIRVSPDGDWVAIGSGQIFTTSDMTLRVTLPSRFEDAAWLAGRLYTIRREGTGETMLESWDSPAFFPQQSAKVFGWPVRLFSLPGGDLLLITSYESRLRFKRIPGGELAGVGDVPYIAGEMPDPVIREGEGVDLSATTFGSGPFTYQWYRDGTAIAGATDPILNLAGLSPNDAGSYTVVVSNAFGSSVSSAANVTVDYARLYALSIRGLAGAGDETLIPGMVIGGALPKKVVMRAQSSVLAQFGIPDLLEDPILTLYDGQNPIMTNDDWGGDPVIADAFAAVGLSPLAVDSLDAAFATEIATGAYTAHVTGAAGTGVVNLELYDAEVTNYSSRLQALALRGYAGTGDAIMIVGMVVAGNSPAHVVMRGVGPSMGPEVPTRMTDPEMILYRYDPETQQSIPFASNDDWGGGSELAAAMAEVGLTALSPTSKDAAMLVSLEPGIYTVHVRGVNSTTGVVLMELYEVP